MNSNICLRWCLQSARGYNNLGQVLIKLKRWREASGAVQEAVRLAPSSVEPHTSLGLLLAKVGRMEEAVAVLETAKALSPAHPVVCYNLALAVHHQGDVKRAERMLRECTNGNGSIPLIAPALLGLSSMVYLRGDREYAIKLLHRAVAVKPDSAVAYAHLGHLSSNIPGKPLPQQPAFQFVSTALRLSPALPVALLIRGHLLGDNRMLSLGNPNSNPNHNLNPGDLPP